MPTFKQVAIAAHPKLPEARAEAVKIAAFFEANGIRAVHGWMNEETLTGGARAGAFDMWIALGGDGTMLRSGHLCGPHGIPILGINMGNVGFLTGVQRGEWPDMLAKLLDGDYWLEPRMMLQAEQYRNGDCLGRWHVLNEAMVGRGHYMRPVRLVTSVDGSYLTTYVADGLIAATPTGSTAYALAAGGPVLPPDLRNILIVPVAPHLSFDRPIVLAEGSFVSIEVHTHHTAILSPDGQPPATLEDGDQVEVRASEHTVHFVRLQDLGYFYHNLTSHMNLNFSPGANA
ncbi:MAG: NAD(+)/NADH kinase [Anaerolineales bacterium]